MDFVDRLYELIRSRNTKQIAMAEFCGIAQNTISGWKRRGSLPQADIAIKMAEFLGVSVEYLVTGKEADKSEIRPAEREIIGFLRDLSDADIELIAPMIRARAEKNRESQGDTLPMQKRGDVERIPPEEKETLITRQTLLNTQNKIG